MLAEEGIRLVAGGGARRAYWEWMGRGRPRPDPPSRKNPSILGPQVSCRWEL